MAAYEPWMRRLVPLMVALFLATMGIGALIQARDARNQAVASALDEIELVAHVVAQDFDAAVADNPGLDAQAWFDHNLPSRAILGGREVLVTDNNGIIVASSAPGGSARQPLADLLGPAQPLTVFADKAGVLRITIANGDDVLAAVRSVKPPFSQLAIIHSISGVLADWRFASYRTGFLLLATAFVLIVIATAYFWQAGRSVEAEHVNSRVHARIDTALSRGRCGLWDWDLARGRIYWSASMYAILGLEPGHGFISVGDVNAMFHPDDGDLTQLAQQLADVKLGSVDHVFRLRAGDGHWVWLRARAEVVKEMPGHEMHLVGIAVDISDEKRIAEHNEASDERLRDAIEALSEALVVWDADNRLVTCNSKFLDLHKLSPQVARPGISYAELIAFATPPVIQTQLPTGEAPNSGARSYEAQLGDGRWLQINERRTKDGGYVSVGTDITLLKRHEEELVDHERKLLGMVHELRRSRRDLQAKTQELWELATAHEEKKVEAETANRAKSEFLANMSHELRTPLNAIIGFSELMVDETFGPLGSPKYRDYAADIATGGHQLLKVISDVLEMARLDSGRVKLEHRAVDVAQVIRTVVSGLHGELAGKSIDISTDLHPGSIVHADPGSLDRILNTLIGNAIKFTAPGGAIEVKSRVANGALNIFVTDTGIGMAPASLEVIGRPFEQAGTVMRNGMKGSGLGLAIARSLIGMHRGSLRIRSAVGVGTMVLVRIPSERHWAEPRLPSHTRLLRTGSASPPSANAASGGGHAGAGAPSRGRPFPPGPVPKPVLVAENGKTSFG